VPLDIVFAGGFFAIVDSESAGVPLDRLHAEDLRTAAESCSTRSTPGSPSSTRAPGGRAGGRHRVHGSAVARRRPSARRGRQSARGRRSVVGLRHRCGAHGARGDGPGGGGSAVRARGDRGPRRDRRQHRPRDRRRVAGPSTWK
jgi:hypothetical protein